MQATRTDPFADMADDLPFDPAEARPPVDMAVAAQPRVVTSDDGRYKEPCKKCRGTGMVTFGYVYIRQGECFACKGKGFFEFKSSPEHRARSAERRANRATEKAAALKTTVAEWAAAHPAEYAWMTRNAAPGSFAASLLEWLHKFGSLTERQLSAVSGKVEKVVQQRASAPAVSTTELEDAFARARAAGLQRVRVTIGKIVVKPASPHSSNPGALYVVDDGTYMGKVMQGRFHRSRDCGPEQEALVLRLLADPKTAAETYGKETGNCCICNRLLTDPESVARGIGPICAGRFGW